MVGVEVVEEAGGVGEAEVVEAVHSSMENKMENKLTDRNPDTSLVLRRGEEWVEG